MLASREQVVMPRIARSLAAGSERSHIRQLVDFSQQPNLALGDNIVHELEVRWTNSALGQGINAAWTKHNAAPLESAVRLQSKAKRLSSTFARLHSA
jgi:hypothetical protein